MSDEPLPGERRLAEEIAARILGGGILPIKDMLGRTPRAVTVTDEQLTFIFDDGAVYEFNHQQDCCEHVYIEDICGDLSDLVGLPILEAYESSSDGSSGKPEQRPFWEPDDPTTISSDDSSTWTFYCFGNHKTRVTVRWLGESNGYYSESVHHYLTEKAA